MEAIIKKFEEEMENAKRLTLVAMCDEGMFDELPDSIAQMMWSMLRLINVSTELTVAQARTIDEINNKLNT